MYEFTNIQYENVPWEKLEACPDHIAFKSRPWVEHVARAYGVTPYILEIHHQHELIGFFIGEKFRKVVTIIAAPFEGWHTPFQGLSMLHPVSRETRLDIYKSLIGWLFESKACSFFQVADWELETQDAATSNLSYERINGYVLDLSCSVDQILQGMHTTAKRHVKGAQKRGVVVRAPQSMEVFAERHYDQLLQVFGRRHLKPTHQKDQIKAQILAMHCAGKIVSVEAVTGDDQPLATVYFFCDNGTAFLVGTASDWNLRHLYPNPPLIFEALKVLKQRGVRTVELGFGGSYKANYGASPYTRARIVASRSRVLSYAKLLSKKSYFGFRGLVALTKQVSRHRSAVDSA